MAKTSKKRKTAALPDDGLMEELKKMPEVREDMVKKGKQLARDPGYPGPETADAVAVKLAGKKKKKKRG